jgi:pimeloyl-ACP methyl ester carboxylesterase
VYRFERGPTEGSPVTEIPGALRGYAQAGRVRLHYVHAGEADGPLVLLPHGFPEFFYGWRDQLPALAQAGFHVIAPDMPGYNLSEKPAGWRAYDFGRLRLLRLRVP